ncbi:MAG: hypothetical protein UU13_C0006G0008 [Candidatus Nomurabacteria bacterium GW2011_GWB1_40_7]|uniref:Uncharacterized protein n=1 Tax=Candidatus Nomurabacteria bacterium GW2011_GWB1_40_7 TaxID=1618744 RepID=A0A0G0T6P6_9BACT|nr:MAG: hypothetical protein UU13_C0006G0008 [Candidatus Nomurabacteria bacterium GW2011_GWB1_40_7]
MNLQNKKLFIGLFILLAYISIGVFGLLKFNHTAETPMTNCPYAKNGFSMCDNSLSHINNWHQFSKATLLSFFFFSFLIFGIILYFSGKQKFLNQKQYFYRWRYYLYGKRLYNIPNRIIKWLSLFENSPAVNAPVFL